MGLYMCVCGHTLFHVNEEHSWGMLENEEGIASP